ncbi:transcription termination factor MTEF18, mitochondrial [Phalaenopsis equestris]|uniref:transcription termination factor MTEF18, mitochondrial n=1 Tax=Phalaenopsis equestris TaxID=78828 RepID=UPI0009E396B0|nr:transcription termination factor MTEF18, mitochondrial [Phalaenopsis equestris]
MRFLPSTYTAGTLSLFLRYRRFLSFTTTTTSFSSRKLKNLHYRNRTRALTEAKLALTEYLHATRALPFTLADHIASNSPISLSTFVSQIPFNKAIPSDFPRIIRSFFAYRPVNEFDFFYESIGLAPSHPSLPSGTPLFLSDDARLLATVSSLLRFGFPWTLLGLLYLNSPSIFSSPPGHLLNRLQRFEALGFTRVSVIAICLAFPSTLSAVEEDVEIERLFRDLKVVFVDYGLDGCAGDDVELLLRFCRRIRIFYDMCSWKEGMGELMGRSKRIFVEIEESGLTQKLGFFLKLGMRKDEVGAFTLKNVEVFDFDLENPEILIPDYLMRVGLCKEEVDSLTKRHPYVLGKNKLGNLPGILRTLDLDKWFCTKIVDEKNISFLSPSYANVDSCDNELEAEFVQDLKRIKLVKQHQFVEVKVEFFLSIGFGKNKMTSKAIGLVSGNKELLQKRFDCLIGMGIKYDMLCRIIIAAPKILNQCENMLRKKVNYLCQDLGYPIEYLNSFPSFLCFDLEKRIKPRYKILNWLRDNGVVKKPFAPATVLANSEKRFIFNLSCIHPAAPKQWLECFSSHKDCNADKETC